MSVPYIILSYDHRFGKNYQSAKIRQTYDKNSLDFFY